jgi:hypothetical protein
MLTDTAIRAVSPRTSLTSRRIAERKLLEKLVELFVSILISPIPNPHGDHHESKNPP